MAKKLDQVMSKLKSSKTSSKVEEDEDYEEEDEDVEEEDDDEEEVEERPKKKVKKLLPKMPTPPNRPSPEEVKAREIEILQNDGVFRVELLYRLDELIKVLKGEDGEEK